MIDSKRLQWHQGMSNNTFQIQGEQQNHLHHLKCKKGWEGQPGELQRRILGILDSSASKEVALEAAGSSSWHWDSDIQHPTRSGMPQVLPLPQLRRMRRGPGGKAGSICVIRCTHTDPITHLLPQLSRARQAQGTHGQQLTARASTHSAASHSFSALTGIFLPSHPKRSLMLYTSYIRQNWECCHVSYKQKNKSDQRFDIARAFTFTLKAHPWFEH